VVISASHNPAPDNGIKLFGPGGVKLDDETEQRVEGRVSSPVARSPVGTVLDRSGDHNWYVDALVASLTHRLDGIKVVVDCANGAASTVAAEAYRGAGANVSVINTDLSGERINADCGATHLEALQGAVVAEGADVGIAHDGDADRCLAVAADGSVVDGDQILAVLATDLHQRGALAGDELVVTVMSNLGLHRAMRAQRIAVAVTPVGDRHVAERMRADGAVLGGEQSGHVVLLEHASTGDGILTGLQLLAAVAAAGRPLAELAAVMQTMPQVLVNVRASDPKAAISATQALIDDTAARLGDDGRVLVRPSGTEPLVRVMVEAATDEAARADAERIAAAIEAVG
jgi:phosphoglucosamine mutase